MKVQQSLFDDDSDDKLMGGSSDLKIDFVLQDDTEKIIYLVQTKFLSMGKRAKKRGGSDCRWRSGRQAGGRHCGRVWSTRRWVRQLGATSVDGSI